MYKQFQNPKFLIQACIEFFVNNKSNKDKELRLQPNEISKFPKIMKTEQ